jgi:hypothetical protein
MLFWLIVPMIAILLEIKYFIMMWHAVVGLVYTWSVML